MEDKGSSSLWFFVFFGIRVISASPESKADLVINSHPLDGKAHVIRSVPVPLRSFISKIYPLPLL